MKRLFSGVIVPTLTPLTADEGLDRDAIPRFVDFLVDAGVDGLFILGSNGEGATLRSSVREALAETTVEAAGGRVPVIAGVLETATVRVVEQMRALDGRGLAGFVVTTPYYFSSWSKDGELYDHFRRITEAADLPVLLYNIPQMTGVALTANLVRRVAGITNVAGLKDSSGDWTEFQDLLLDRPNEDFALLQGLQSLSVASLAAGADGLIPGYANVHPRLLVELVEMVRMGDLTRAFTLQARLDRLLRIRGRAILHANKVVARALGLMQDHVTAPLPHLTPAEARAFLDASIAAGLPLPAESRLP